MIRDITIGQYCAKESPIHKLDPRTKIVATFFYIVTMFWFHRLLGYAIAAAFLAIVIALSKVPFSYIIKGMKPLLMILVFTMMMNGMFSTGDVLFHYGIINVTVQGIRNAVFMGIRLCLLVFGASMMTFTTTPNQLTDAIEKMFGWMNKLHVPVHEIAMMMSIALRFIPILLEETDKIMKAQMARGADFETGGIIKRLKSMVPLLVPLFVSAFRRANDLAMAMEARCYRGGIGRTKMKPLSYRVIDGKAYAILVGYIVLLLVLVKIVPEYYWI